MNDARNVCLVATMIYATIRSCCAISTATGTRSSRVAGGNLTPRPSRNRA